MIGAVFFSFLLFGTLASLDESLRNGADASEGQRLITNNKNHFTQPLPIAYAGEIRGMVGAGKVSYASWFGAYFRDPINEISAYAVEAKSYLDIYREANVSAQDAERFFGQKDALLVGAAVATRHGWKVGDRVPLGSSVFQNARGSAWDFEVVAVFEGTSSRVDTGYILMHYAYLDEARTQGKGLISWIVSEPPSGEPVQLFGQIIDDTFATRQPSTSTNTEQALNQAFGAQFGNVGLILRVVSALVFFTVILVVTSNLIVTLRERCDELAVLKAIGFTSARLAVMHCSEVAIIFGLGSVPGLLCSIFLVRWLSVPLSSILPGLTVTPAVLAVGLTLAAALAMVLAIFPASVAWRQSPGVLVLRS